MRHVVLLVLDSLRHDVLADAHTPFLDSLGRWHRAQTHGTFTLPAHAAMFAGRLPHASAGEDYVDSDTVRTDDRRRRIRGRQLWRLDNPESPRPAHRVLQGRDIVEGFGLQGYRTLGTGAVSWFDPDKPAGEALTRSFDEFHYVGGRGHRAHAVAELQIDWALDRVRAGRSPCFLFVNFGETHHRYVFQGCEWIDEPDPFGDAAECRFRQRHCVEYLDGQIERLLGVLGDCELVICSDHGDAMGEDDLWGHGFAHPTVLQVPLLIRVPE
jgi:arylsulfatase A-like enzyme